MSSADTASDPKPGRRPSKRAEKKSLWQMDLSSIGKKDEAAADEQVEHAPFVATLPGVNLLPQAVRDSVAVSKVRRWFVLGIVLIALVTGALWWLQGSTIAKAESDLAAATAQNTKLRTDLEALGPVKQMYEQITRLQNLVTTTMASQPEAALVIQSLSDAAQRAGGDAIAFTGADITYTGIPAAGDELNICPDPDPFDSDVTIGCLTFNATAETREEVSALLRELEADPLFLGPYVTSTTATEIATGPDGKKTRALVAFSGSAGVSLEALKTKLTPEQIQELLTPPKPEPSATASPAAGGAS